MYLYVICLALILLLLSFVSVAEAEEEEPIPTGVILVPASGAFEVKESINSKQKILQLL